MNLKRLIELGIVQSNEPAAPAAVEAPITGGGSAPAEAPADSDGVEETPSALWDELANDSEELGGEMLEEVEAPATAAAPTPAAPPAAAAPAAPVVPEVKAPEQPPVAQQPAATPPAADPAKVQMEDYQALIDRTHTELEQRYQLSEEDAQRLHTEPEKVLPKIAAQLVLDVTQSTIAQVARMMPQAILRTMERTKQLEEGEQSFYKEWPDLKGKDEVVLRIGRAYRQMYPQATREQFIREVGAQAAVALRLPIDPVTGKIAQPAAQQQQQRPYTPPRAAASPAPKAGNEWELLSEEFIDN